MLSVRFLFKVVYKLTRLRLTRKQHILQKTINVFLIYFVGKYR